MQFVMLRLLKVVFKSDDVRQQAVLIRRALDGLLWQVQVLVLSSGSDQPPLGCVSGLVLGSSPAAIYCCCLSSWDNCRSLMASDSL